MRIRLRSPSVLSHFSWHHLVGFSRFLAQTALLISWVLLAAMALHLGFAQTGTPPPMWALGLAMLGALTGHLLLRRVLWPDRLPEMPEMPAETDVPTDAMHLDAAVEQGRGEERVRIAQDLHDDIGARLLTLMYQAHTPEMENYIRHTLQDLKTLTRGLAAPSHSLSAAAAEWRCDMSHRLALARCELVWEMNTDEDVDLSMVQWSALTRILRELVSNAISHAHAHQVRVRLILNHTELTLSVSDNGEGRAPHLWSHGLGLGGVRKRVTQLNGQVNWRELSPAGICCEVVAPHFVGQVQRSH